MLLEWYEKNYILYGLLGVCALGFLLRFMSNLYYRYLVKASENVGETTSKLFKQMKMKYDACYKIKLFVHNVDMFVDKQGFQMRFCGIRLSTWDNLCGQIRAFVLFASALIGIWAFSKDCGQTVIIENILFSFTAVAFFYLVDKLMNEPLKQRMIHTNLVDYFENYLSACKELERSHPELMEAFREEFHKIEQVKKASDKKISKDKVAKHKVKNASKKQKGSALEETTTDELDRRREARKRKEELKKELAMKREEEQRKLELARLEEEKRRIEEKKERIAKLREEERLRAERMKEEIRIREEKRRLEATRREEEKRIALEKKREEERRYKEGSDKSSGMKEEMKEEANNVTDFVAATCEEALTDNNHEIYEAITERLSPEEQKLIEDVLKEFLV